LDNQNRFHSKQAKRQKLQKAWQIMPKNGKSCLRMENHANDIAKVDKYAVPFA
jgi:hypothetical protein